MSDQPKSIDDGGPAFPGLDFHQAGPSLYHNPGMSLRDKFAGDVAAGLASAGVPKDFEKQWAPWVADMSYEISDALIARGKK